VTTNNDSMKARTWQRRHVPPPPALRSFANLPWREIGDRLTSTANGKRDATDIRVNVDIDTKFVWREWTDQGITQRRKRQYGA